MDINLKLRGMTPKSGESLCETCRRATIVRGENFEHIIQCGALNDPNDIIKFRVVDCTDYETKLSMSMSKMESLAWNIEPRKRGATGFTKTYEAGDDMEYVITPPTKKSDNEPWDN